MMQGNRRDFIKSLGCLTVGFSLGSNVPRFLLPTQELPGLLQRYNNIDAWLQVLADGRVRVLTGKMELGQGIRTAIAQVAAEELDLEMDRVEVTLASTGVTPNEGYTAGSASIETSAMSVRYAAAVARRKLLELAAQQLDQPLEQLGMMNGKISSRQGGRAIAFNELLDGRKLSADIRMPVTLKPKDQYRLVGRPVPREDIARMVRGEYEYVQDLRFPGMVHARVVRPPAYGARLQHADEAALRQKFPGLLKMVVDGSFLGVISEDEYTAMQAQLFLREHTRWTAAAPLPAGELLPAYLKTLPASSRNVRNTGEAPPAGSKLLKAAYFKPYIMHGSIGPSCAVALYKDDNLQVWTHSQGVYPLRETLHKLLQLPEERIQVTGVPGSGCYGHNGADDAAADAALLAVAFPGRHIRLQWSREEEHAWEPYGSAMIMEVAALLNGQGKISHWQYQLWSDTHGTRPGGNPQNVLAARYLASPFGERPAGYSGGAYRNAEPYYSIPNQQVDAHFFDGPLRTSSLRSLGAYANIFAIESFMDELAEKAGEDPYTFRLQHLSDERAAAVIRRLREMVGSPEAVENTGVGMAFARYKNSAAYCAAAALVTVNPATGHVRVEKMWAAIDAGEVINTDGVINQTEGGMIQAASWTLQEQVQFDRQQVSSRDWQSYPVIRFTEVPEVEVAVLNRPAEEPLGAGEAVQGPAGAAIVNALYRASGKRIRQLPVLPHFKV